MPETLPTQEALVSASPGFGTLETVFEALGRILVVLDRDFRVIRASHTLDDLAYPERPSRRWDGPSRSSSVRGSSGRPTPFARRSSRDSGRKADGRSSAAEKEAPASSR